MKTADFLFDLPESLIAQYPPPVRGRSRLMVLDRASGKRRHRLVEELPEILTAPVFGAASAGPSGVSSGSGPAGLAAGRLPLRKPGLPTGKPLLVFNNSRVRRARLVGISRDTGKEGEFLLIRRCASHTWQAMVKKAKRRRPGSRYVFAGGLEGEI
ncbi:MAG: S-adenosylmethionine:tRNA ribosyltransferase-isomerase, partial [Treponema sp.]|nr:S-adenosylmethionine:tRNA ribosyltransferase-isomerase [Treponema sp.]